MRRALGLCAALAAAAAGGCRTHAATQLLVVVGTNIPVGTSLETIEIEITDGTPDAGLLGQRTITVSNTPTPPLTVAMPFSFGVAPAGGDASRRVRVTARGRFRDTGLRDRVVLTAVTGFLEDQKLLLPMLLDQRCVDFSACAEGLTCIAGECRPAAVDPRSLRSLDPEVTVPASALIDAAVADLPATDAPPIDVTTDAGFDAPADAGSDAPADAGSDVRTNAGLDAPADAGFDVPADAGFEASVDAAPDVPLVDTPSLSDVPPTGVRLLAPTAGSEVMMARPPLRWRARTSPGQVVTVVLCRQRDCVGDRRVQPAATGPTGDDWLLVAGESAGLPAGRWWWSVHLDGGSVLPSASDSWWFVVPPGRGAVATTSAPWRTLAGFDGDGVARVVVGSPMVTGAGAAGERSEVAVFDPRVTATSTVLARPGGGDAAQYAAALAIAGDVDGDGRIDLAVGEPGRAVHVYRNPFPSTADGTSGVAALTDESTMYFGGTVVGVGDVDRDGYADLAVTAQTLSGEGLVWVYRGAPGGPSTPTRVSLRPPTLPATALYGKSVAAAGDMNGDGYSDVAVGDPSLGAVYVFDGGPLGPASTPRTLAAPAGWTGLFPLTMAPAGDVNADGYGDLIVASESDVVIYLGGSAMPGARAVRPNVAAPPCLNAGANAVLRVAGVGDVDADGFDDVVVVAPGRCAVLYRGATGAPATLTPTTAIVRTATPGFGESVAGVGDVDGDGLPDFAIGSPGVGGVTPPPGFVGVWAGRATWAPATPESTYVRAGPTSHFGRRIAQ